MSTVPDLSAATLWAQSAQLKNRIVLIDLEQALAADQALAFARYFDLPKRHVSVEEIEDVEMCFEHPRCELESLTHIASRRR